MPIPPTWRAVAACAPPGWLRSAPISPKTSRVPISACVSPRYLQMLFDAEGTTFSEFVLEQRLARIHRLLTDPRLDKLPIGVIALDAGFGDLSYFNRVFRRRYGATPSEIRAAAARENNDG